VDHIESIRLQAEVRFNVGKLIHVGTGRLVEGLREHERLVESDPRVREELRRFADEAEHTRKIRDAERRAGERGEV
jgi:hypothetical protein